ncbi:Os10g0579850, partial [Oryza sativa Japonica Group]
GLLGLVAGGEQQVEGEVGEADEGPEPEVVVEVGRVQVRRQPAAGAVAPLGDRRHDGDDERVDVEAEGEGEEGESGADAAHGPGRLAVEELQLRDAAEHVGSSQHHELWHLPQDAHRPLLPSQPPPLHQSSRRHGHHHQHTPHAHPLQLRQTTRAPPPPRHRHHHHVVEQHPQQHEHHLHRHQRRHRHPEPPPEHPRVHGHPLLDEGGGHLPQRRRVQHARHPDGHYPRQHLHALHLAHRAHLPHAAPVHPHGGLVQPP